MRWELGVGVDGGDGGADDAAAPRMVEWSQNKDFLFGNMRYEMLGGGRNGNGTKV